jgi:hypothetical protein
MGVLHKILKVGHPKIISTKFLRQKVFKMKIWIYWSESNSWIYFYIHVVLNKNWKIYWSDQQFYWSWDEGPVLIVRNVIYYNSGDFYSLQWWSVIKTIKFCDKFLSLTYGRLVVGSNFENECHGLCMFNASFISGWNHCLWRKPPTCHKSMTKIYHKI